MDSFYLEDEVQKILNNRRYEAQFIADANTHEARKNPAFLELENKIGGLIIDAGQAQFEGKSSYKIEKQIIELKLEQDKILKDMHLSREMLMPQFCCSLCKDTGFVDGKKCSCVKKIINSLLKDKCGMPVKPVTFSDCKDVDEKTLDVLVKICENYPDNKKYTNLLIVGDSGVGKTYLTHAMANKFIEKQLYTIFATATHMNNDFLKYHTTFTDDKIKYFAPYLECDVLIIDDLGTENVLKNITKEYLLSLINERQTYERLTIITTNLTNDGIIERYGERVFSRLFNKLNCICMEIKNKDLRLKK